MNRMVLFALWLLTPGVLSGQQSEPTHQILKPPAGPEQLLHLPFQRTDLTRVRWVPGTELVVLEGYLHVTVCDVAKGKMVWQLKGTGSFDISRDGKLLACIRVVGSLTNGECSLEFYDLATLQQTHPPIQVEPRSVGYPTLSPDRRWLAVAKGPDNGLCIFEVATGKKLFSHQDPRPARDTYICNLAFSPDGKTLVAARCDQTITLWDCATWKPRKVLEGPPPTLFPRDRIYLQLTSDGRTLASLHENRRRLALWNMENGTREYGELVGTGVFRGLSQTRFKGDGGLVAYDFAAAPSSQTLAFAGVGEFGRASKLAGQLGLYDLATRKARCCSLQSATTTNSSVWTSRRTVSVWRSSGSTTNTTATSRSSESRSRSRDTADGSVTRVTVPGD